MKIKKVNLNENFLNVPIAHRGLHSDTVAENSMQAFILAKEKNIAIEIDIHRLADGKFVVFHDKNLKRVVGENVMLSTLTSTELSKYKLWDNQPIPLFEDVLKEIDGKVPLLIELKPENGFKIKDIPDFLEILKNYNHNEMVAIQSFNPFLVKELKTKTNDFAVGILSSHELGKMSKIKNFFYRTVPLFEMFKFDFVSYDIRYLPSKTIESLKKKGFQLLTWCIDTPEKLEKAKTLADNIIFEKLEVNENLFFKK